MTVEMRWKAVAFSLEDFVLDCNEVRMVVDLPESTLLALHFAP